MPAPTRYRFADFTLSPARRSLRRGAREVPLIPRYLDLLILLVERRGVALPRREILDRVWSDVVVSDGALSQAVRTLRRTLGDGDYVRTVSRHGYEFVCPVLEEEDAEDLTPLAERPRGEARTGDPVAEALGRLLDEAASDEARRDAAEDLHALDTGDALRRLAAERNVPAHARARAWAHLRDSRWDVAGAGRVPLVAPPAGPAAWAALVALRLRRALRLAGARWAQASAGGAIAGAVAGVLGGALMATLGGSAALSLLVALALVGALVAGVGAAGVGSGLAAAEVTVLSRRVAALAVLGAAGGGAAGFASRHLALGLLDGLFGLEDPAIGGGFEGLALGAAAGLGFGLGTRHATGGAAAPRGRARLVAVAATALACAVGAAAVSAAGGRLGAASLDSVVQGFPATRVRLEAFGRLLGEAGLGPRTGALLGFGEGLLFGAGLAAGLTRRPGSRARD
jgi:DNA-binding winged helix-turn-helix (wHTH) protein